MQTNSSHEKTWRISREDSREEKWTTLSGRFSATQECMCNHELQRDRAAARHLGIHRVRSRVAVAE